MRLSLIFLLAQELFQGDDSYLEMRKKQGLSVSTLTGTYKDEELWTGGEVANDLHEIENGKIRGPQSGLRRTNYIVPY